MSTKYPRTYHVPFSPGTSSDDRKLTQEEFEKFFIGKDVVISEKLDGENTALTHFDCFARSHGAPTRSPWSRNIWDTDGVFWRVKDKIGEDEIVYGENLYGEHSIHYEDLKAYFHIFAARDNENWYSWDDVELVADILSLPTVPVIFKGKLESEEQLREIIKNAMETPSAYGVEKEGVVIRNMYQFPVEVNGESIFHENVCKYVRAHHVQTGVHWTRDWKKAEIKYC